MMTQIKEKKIGLIFLASSCLVLFFVVLPPHISEEWRFLVMSAFSSVCHQLPDRSFHVADISLAVCHRCTGIYAGIPLAMASILLTDGWKVKKNVWAALLFGSLFLMGLDWGLSVIGIWDNTMISRLTTGSFFGLAAGAFLAYVVTEGAPDDDIDIP